MTQHKIWKTLALLVVLAALATGIWACSTTEQSATAPAIQEPATESTENLAVVAAAPTAATAQEETADEAAPSSETNTESNTEGNTEGNSETGDAVRELTLDPGQSEARFTLDEELLGAPTTVVGSTALVEGSINIDLADLSNTTVGPIQIDARDLTTDSDRRDGAIQRFVLGSTSDENRYIVFTPTQISSFPAVAAVGDTFELQITGDLTISGVTNPVTFVTSITVVSDTQISGLATAQILRADYNLTIPSVPSVANVSEEVLLELSFVAAS